jgi:hypothetical protein
MPQADTLVVRKLGDSMIECYLRERNPGITPERNTGGFFNMVLGHGVLPDFPLSLSLRLEPTDRYTVVLVARYQISKNDWAQMIVLCDSWHADHYFPVASLYPHGSTFAMLMLRNTFSLSAGIHQALFNHFTDTTISAAMEFWRWAVEERGYNLRVSPNHKEGY